MLALLTEWFLGPFIPHGHCYLWKPGLVGLHIVSDSLIAMAYYSIPLTLIYFVRKRRDLPFDWIFWLFGAFIIACGTTHILEVWTLWHPNYWLSGFIKAITAGISLCTAILLVPLIPKALALPSPAQLEEANRQLEQEIRERTAAETKLQLALQQLTFHIENSPLAVIEINNEFRVQRWSQQATNIFGWQAQEVLNQRLDEWQFVFEEDLPGVQQDMSCLLDGSKPYIVGTNRNYTKNGSVIYCEWYNSALWNQSGELVSILSLALDVTERTCAEQALKTSEARYRTLVETSPDAIGVSDLDGQLLLCNRQSALLHGYERETEILGLNTFKLIAPQDRSRAAENFQKILTQGSIRNVEYTLLKKDGSRFSAEFSGSLIRDAQGNPQAIIGLLRDITERKLAEDDLKKVKEDLALRVEERTAQLQQVNDFLLVEIQERRLAEEALRKSEERLKQALSAAQMAAWDWDMLSDRVNWSDGAEALLGLVPGTLVNTYDAFLNCLHPEDRLAVTEAVNRTVETGTDYEVEARIFWPDGTIRWVASFGALLRNVSTPGVRMTGTVMDITKRKQMKLALEREHQQLQQIITCAPVAIAMFDTEMRCVAHSHKWLIVQGLEEQSVIGRSYYELFPDLPEQWKAFHQRALRGEVVSASEDVWERADGTKLYLRWAIHPWYTPDGEVGGIAIATDHINELVEAREAALEAVRVKSEFLANMSHEIRTPMNGVLGVAGLLLQTPLTPQQLDYARTIRSSAEHLLNVINEILDFSKLEAGEMQIEQLDFDLDSCIESAVDVVATQAEEKGLELAIVVESDVPRQLQGDPGRLRQILLNLLSNAIKFTDAGEVVVKVSIELEGSNNELKVQSFLAQRQNFSENVSEANSLGTVQVERSNQSSNVQPSTSYNLQPSNLQPYNLQPSNSVKIRFQVTDTGIGISAADQEKLFQSFSQVDASTTRQYGGTGLGLVICKQLVELMEGEIGVESELGQGSRFWFTALFGTQTVSEGTSIPIKFSQFKVLVVSENATNRESVRTYCTSWGMQIDEATDITATLNVLRSSVAQGHPYNIGIVDLQLSDSQGAQLISMICSDPTLAQTKLIAMLPVHQPDSVQELESMGISGYFIKPVRASRLFDSLMSACGTQGYSAFTPKEGIGEEANTQEQKPHHSRLKILLVEDHPVNQMVIMTQLESLGYQADCVDNGKDAIAKLSQQNYDIVLMDCQMPVLDGYEATKELRRREGLRRHTVVIALTAHALPHDRDKCLAAGMDDYLSKPIEQEVLGEMIDRWAEYTAKSKRAKTRPEVKNTPHPKLSPAALTALNLDETPLDLERLNNISRGKVSFQQQLVQTFVENAQLGLEQMRLALQVNDLVTLEQQAHRIKGSSANVGVRGMPDVAAQLEHLAREKTLEGATEQLETLERQLEQVKAFLNTSRQSPGSTK